MKITAYEYYPYLNVTVDAEGDEKHFEYKGYSCHIFRNKNSGYLCGYVDLDEDDIFYEMDYDDIESKFNCELPSHGGLTYSGRTKDNLWRIGFDCAHYGDCSPFRDVDETESPSDYRTIYYVQRILKEMAMYLYVANRIL